MCSAAIPCRRGRATAASTGEWDGVSAKLVSPWVLASARTAPGASEAATPSAGAASAINETACPVSIFALEAPSGAEASSAAGAFTDASVAATAASTGDWNGGSAELVCPLSVACAAAMPGAATAAAPSTGPGSVA